MCANGVSKVRDMCCEILTLTWLQRIFTRSTEDYIVC